MNNHAIFDTPITNLRLTNRGLFVIRMLIICGVVGVLALLLASIWVQQPLTPAVAADEQTVGMYQEITVHPGDTLWEISSRLAQDNNRAAVLEQIMTYNILETSDLEVGQTLYVPLFSDEISAPMTSLALK